MLKADLLVGTERIGRFEFIADPKVGDSVSLKEDLYTITEVRHNVDMSRLQLLVTKSEPEPVRRGPGRPPRSISETPKPEE